MADAGVTNPRAEDVPDGVALADGGYPRRWRVLAVAVAVAFMAQMDLFIANFSLPSIGRSLGGSQLSGLSWVLDANTIVFAALLVPAGRLADQWGRRRFLLLGVGLFTAATALAAAAPNLPVLVVGRALEGAGAAVMVPTSLGLLLPAFPKHQHTMVAGIWAGVAGLGAACGGPVGGALVGIDWRLVFLANVPIGIATIVAGSRVLPEIRAPHDTGSPDPLSVGTLLGAVTLLVLATVQGPRWGWGNPAIWALFAGAAVCALATARRSLHHPGAVIEASLFRVREFTAGTVAFLLYYLAFAAWLLSTVLYLQDTWHYGLLRSGLALAPAPVAAAVFGIGSGRIGKLIGNHTLAVVGPTCMALSGAFWLIAAPAHPSYVAGFLPGLVLAGISSGLTQAPLYATAGALPSARQATGSAVLNTARQIGSAVGVALAVVLLASTRPHELGAFHRDWVLIVGAATLAATVAALGLARLRAQAPAGIASTERAPLPGSPTAPPEEGVRVRPDGAAGAAR